MDQKAIAFARSWARRYVRTKHPHGLDAEDVENRILESLYKYSRGNPGGLNGRDGLCPVRGPDEAGPSQSERGIAPQWMMEALAAALNDIQNESRRNLRALRPWQVRNAEPHLETQAYRNLACDMHSMRIRQSVRENDRRKVRLALAMLPPEDRRVADEFMALLSWQKVAAHRGMSEGTFRRRVLAGFIVRFKEAWSRIS